MNFKTMAVCVTLLTVQTLVPEASAQSRLPASVNSNTYTLGLMLGCIIRAQTYLEVSRENLATARLDLPPNYQNLDLVVGIDTSALLIDLNQALLSLTGPSFDAELQTKMISDVARLEYGSPYGGATLYNESWGQMAACGYQFHIHGIYRSYPPVAP